MTNLRPLAGAAVLCSLCVVACGSDANSPAAVGIGGQPPGAGGSVAPSSGGANSQTTAGPQTGGATASGGSTPSTGGTNSATGGASSDAVGGASTGGMATTRGGNSSTGGVNSSGGSMAGGSTATGGKAAGGSATGGASNAGGSIATGGKAAGGSATGGASNAGGSTATGGKAAGGSATGGASTGGANRGGATTGGGSSTGLDPFSFFVASEASLIQLSGNAKGFGGDLRYGQATGLAGADKICAAVAELSMPGASAKQWRAFLSIAANGGETAVNAIDRVGSGPWYDRLGRVVSLNVTQLKSARPAGADSAIINDLPNEWGTPNHSPNGSQVDNHDTLTGSNTQGQLASTYANTCNNWTSSASATGKPVLGHSWTAQSGTNWIQVGHTGGGCAPCNAPTGGAQQGESGTVGSMGGYGGFYCFALSP